MPIIYKTEEEKKAARAKTVANYQKKATTKLTFRFHNVNDAEIIAKIQEQQNKCDYIRQLVKKDIEK